MTKKSEAFWKEQEKKRKEEKKKEDKAGSYAKQKYISTLSDKKLSKGFWDFVDNLETKGSPHKDYIKWKKNKDKQNKNPSGLMVKPRRAKGRQKVYKGGLMVKPKAAKRGY